MSVWDLYAERMNIRGETKRETMLNREKRYQSMKVRDSLSYHIVTLDGDEREVAIIDTDNLDTKFIYSLPDEDITCGAMVEWDGNHWLVTERDANNEVYTRAKMLQCNYLLRWVDDEKVIHEQWCIIEDGTKYLTGEYEDRQFIVTRGDSRIAMTIARNEHTAKFNRENRFLIDDEASPHKLAYALTKPLKLGGVYNGEGVYKFVLQEVNTTDLDNQDLRIADYYKYFPHESDAESETPVSSDGDNGGDNSAPTSGGKKGWL